MRDIYGPKINPADYSLSVKLGGTGRMKITEVADALQLVRNADKGQPNGPIALGANSQIDVSKIPAIAGTNAVNLQGTFTGSVNVTLTWKITDYDSFKTYDVSATAGTISRSGDTITFVAPATGQTVTVTVAGRQIPVVIDAVRPDQPTINSPVNGASTVSNVGVEFAASVYAAGGSGTHASSDWQISTDSLFGTIVQQSIANTVNKTLWNSAALAASTTYYVRCRYRGSNGNYSNYSPTVSFTTQAPTAMTIEEAKLIGSDSGSPWSGQQGTLLAIDGTGTRVAVGGYWNGSTSQGAVYIFTRSGTTWTQEAKLQETGVTYNSSFGCAASFNSDASRIAIGAYGHNSADNSISQIGAVIVFSRSGTTWTQEFVIYPTDGIQQDYFGWAVAMSGDGSRCIITKRRSMDNVSKAYVFVRSGSNWSQDTTLQSSDIASSDYFGTSAAISTDGNRAVIGAPYGKNTSGTIVGAAYIFERNTSTNAWTQQAKLQVGSAVQLESIGSSVAIDGTGTRAVIGTTKSKAYVYLRNASAVWGLEATLQQTDGSPNDAGGISVAMSDDGLKVIFGAYAASPGNLSSAGAAYMFSKPGATWGQVSKIIASDKFAGGFFGQLVAMSKDGTRSIIGSPKQFNNLGQGSSYIYR